MTEITAALVKELRDRTSAGMMDCKKALSETKGDIEAAIDWLRKKGLSKAATKADRIAAEGLVGVLTAGKSGALVEVNSETDFVARNEQFQDAVEKIASLALKAGGDTAKLLAMPFPGKSETVDAHLKEMVATIGENMTLRRTVAVDVAQGAVSAYVHNKAKDGLGKIGVLVALEGSGDETKLGELGRQIAMHIAARNPVALDISGVPADILAREKAIIMDKNQGKPAHVLEKIAESSMKTYAKENTLLEQAFVLDESKTIAQVLKEAGGAKIKQFVRYGLGEGIEKKQDDFAAEVAAAAGTAPAPEPAAAGEAGGGKGKKAAAKK